MDMRLEQLLRALTRKGCAHSHQATLLNNLVTIPIGIRILQRISGTIFMGPDQNASQRSLGHLIHLEAPSFTQVCRDARQVVDRPVGAATHKPHDVYEAGQSRLQRRL